VKATESTIEGARVLVGDLGLSVRDAAALLGELERALAYPKVRSRVAAAEAAAFVTLLRETALVEADPPAPPRRSPDSGDDCLVALAGAAGALLVSGDAHVLALADRFPILAPRLFLEALERSGEQ